VTGPAGERLRASIALVSMHGAQPLRAALHNIRETADQPHDVVILAAQHQDDVVEYIARHYLRGDVAAIGLDTADDGMSHCGLDRAVHFSSGDVLVRVQDDLEFAPGWLGHVLTTLEAHPEIGMLGLLQGQGKRPRGRPPKAPRGPEPVDEVDLRAFAVRRDLFGAHESALRGERCAEGCLYQARLPELGYTLALLPGLVKPAAVGVPQVAGDGLEADLPFHAGAAEARSALRQIYQLGEEVLLPCLACGDDEFEVLAAHIEFCEAHGVPIGYTYTLRCAGCGATHDEEDPQFRCR
jgi:hypothetical protein